MAMVIVKMRIMPESPDIDLSSLQESITAKINSFCGLDNAVKNIEVSPVAFGLKALDITFTINEAKGDTEPLEEELKSIEGINSVEVTSVSRALG